MSGPVSGLTIDELAEQAGVPIRTVRYYIAEGLLPGPGTRGKGALYSGEQLSRLLLIRRLTERHMPLAEIREVLAGLGPGEARALLQQEDRRAATLRSAARSPAPKEYISALLESAREARGGLSKAARAPEPPAVVPQTMRPPLTEPPGETWERVELAPGLELHVRADAKQHLRPLIARIRAAAAEERQEPPRA